ncbi:MAG: minor capsid protein, partial [Clostridia bacterium]
MATIFKISPLFASLIFAELQSYKDDGIIYYRYSAYLDNRTSEICKNLNGKVFKVESARTGNNYPPMHP